MNNKLKQIASIEGVMTVSDINLIDDPNKIYQIDMQAFDVILDDGSLIVIYEDKEDEKWLAYANPNLEKIFKFNTWQKEIVDRLRAVLNTRYIVEIWENIFISETQCYHERTTKSREAREYPCWYFRGTDYAIKYPSKSRAKQALRKTEKYYKTKFKDAKIKAVML